MSKKVLVLYEDGDAQLCARINQRGVEFFMVELDEQASGHLSPIYRERFFLSLSHDKLSEVQKHAREFNSESGRSREKRQD